MKSKFNPHLHHRRSIRLKGFDYSQKGSYFVTICTRQMVCLFGQIQNKKSILNEAGKMIDQEWLALVDKYANIELGEYVVMPNHFHAILNIGDKKANPTGVPSLPEDIPDWAASPSPNVGQTGKVTLGMIIGAFKSITTVKYIEGVKCRNWQPFNGRLWQRNYYEHIIRNRRAYQSIAVYIRNNPTKWKGVIN